MSIQLLSIVKILFISAVILTVVQANIRAADEPAGQSVTNQEACIAIPLLPGEKLWSGVIKEGENQPYSAGADFNFFGNNEGNQIQPLLMSDRGLWVWSEEPYAFEIRPNQVVITNLWGEVKYGRAGGTLAGARQYVSAHFFPPSGRMPDEKLFTAPQYNTWIELNYNQNQADVLKYARGIVAAGFPPGVLMIDDTWEEDYGLWQFHPGRFPDPRQMLRELHRMGFKVMLWVCPFVSPDQAQLMKKLVDQKALLMQATQTNTSWAAATDSAIIKWWDGYSAELDFNNPTAVDWFSGQLERLVKEEGVDGFKFDAGDPRFYPSYALSRNPVSPNRQCELYAQFGLRFPLNEYRACWKMAGQPLGQRLYDKKHNWEDLQKLIPDMLTEGLAGYTFSCPDMIGGGYFDSFINLDKINQDLVVRAAQIHALMPMMQFSLAPWRVLDARHLAAVKRAVAIRQKFAPAILKLARHSAATGDPIIRSLEYEFPHQGFGGVKDEFMLGDSLLVAPAVEPGTHRKVILPEGKWLAEDGQALTGGASYDLEVPLDRLPYFQREP